MNTELRLHGQITPDIEYYATAAGCRSAHQHFFQALGDDLRFFAPGNELTLTTEGIRQAGTGGTFCEYMFGVEQPLSDLTKIGIFNRLMLLEADRVSGEQSYEDIFVTGHAIDNYFFFITGLEGSSHQQRQAEILRFLGKSIKRLPYLNRQGDSELAEQLLELLPDDCTIYLIRLSHLKNRHFQQEFQSLYYKDRSLPEQALDSLDDLATSLEIPPYQQERIRIDVMYHHRDNYRIIDDYRKVLIDCFLRGDINRQQHARLTRLKTLALRNEIPETLLTTLDERLQSRISSITREPEYTAITRDIFQDLLVQKGIGNRDMIQLLIAKQHARRNHDHSFEQLLLETGCLFDEQIRDGAPISLLEDFSYIITFFDRYDSTATNISRIAFMEHFNPTEELLRSLVDSRHEFNALAKGLFNKLFFDDILSSRYLGRYGRKRVLCLQAGLDEIAAGVCNLSRLAAELRLIHTEERLYSLVLQTAKERIRTRYSRYNTVAEQNELFEELNSELLLRGQTTQKIDPDMFQSIIHDIKKEALYLRNLLPQIIANNDTGLRNDFLANSGLDHFYIEELEREYFELNQLATERLQQLRSKTL